MNNTPPAHDAIENLLTVLDVVRAHAPADVATWFGEGVDAFMSSNGPLDRCLGFVADKQGDRFVSAYRIAQRNYFLKQAWLLCEPETEMTPWKRSGVLEVAVNEFLDRWPLIEALSAPDPDWSQLRTALFNACKYCLPPVSQRQLHDVARPRPDFARSPTDVSAQDSFLYKQKLRQ